MRLSLLIFPLLVSFSFSHAQNETSWKGKKCAVVLTYDDALNVHLDNAIPLLDSLGLKGTFYLSGNFPGSRQHSVVMNWRTILYFIHAPEIFQEGVG
jgi:peptidoglycan/xylan/chitin deacetylase (PgdA/CDA1 family)